MNTINIEIEFDVFETYRGVPIVKTFDRWFDAIIGGTFLLVGSSPGDQLQGWHSILDLKHAIGKFIGEGYELIRPRDAVAGDECYCLPKQTWYVWSGGPTLQTIWRRKTKLEENIFDRIALGQIDYPNGIEFQVAQDIAKRQQAGVAKYGTTVADSDLPAIDWLQHAYEEALDLAIYLKKSIEVKRGEA